MDPAAKIILWVYGTVAVIVLFLLIYLIIKRIEKKKNEDFESRTN